MASITANERDRDGSSRLIYAACLTTNATSISSKIRTTHFRITGTSISHFMDYVRLAPSVGYGYQKLCCHSHVSINSERYARKMVFIIWDDSISDAVSVPAHSKDLLLSYSVSTLVSTRGSFGKQIRRPCLVVARFLIVHSCNKIEVRTDTVAVCLTSAIGDIVGNHVLADLILREVSTAAMEKTVVVLAINLDYPTITVTLITKVNRNLAEETDPRHLKNGNVTTFVTYADDNLTDVTVDETLNRAQIHADISVAERTKAVTIVPYLTTIASSATDER